MKKGKEGKAEYMFAGRGNHGCFFFLVLETRGLQCDCYHIFWEEKEEDDRGAKAHHLLLQCFIVWLKAMDMKLAALVACVCVYCASLFT